MIYAVQVELSFPTQSRRDAFQSSTAIHLAAEPRTWGAETVRPADAVSTVVEARFETVEARDAAVAAIQRNAAQAGGQGKVAHHLCTHDQTNPTPCTVALEQPIRRSTPSPGLAASPDLATTT